MVHLSKKIKPMLNVKDTKKVLIAIIILFAVGISLTFLIGNNKDSALYYGYIEGEYIRVAAPSSAYLNELYVTRGESITAGQPLFQMDLTAAQAERERASAAAARVKAEFADLTKGNRAEELKVLEAQLQEAKAALKRATLEFDRQQDLIKKKLTSASAFDAAKATRDENRARVRSLEATIRVAKLPARDDKQEAAQLAIQEAESNLAIAEHRLEDLQPAAPTDAMVKDTFYLPGEWVPANSVIVSLLPHDKVKLKFFVPQAHIAKLKPGTDVQFACDGCPEQLTAVISYISPEVELTPPIIYSAESRDKLVFLVEAKPHNTTQLPIGLPIEVSPLQ